jgi:hypothetical protein
MIARGAWTAQVTSLRFRLGNAFGVLVDRSFCRTFGLEKFDKFFNIIWCIVYKEIWSREDLDHSIIITYMKANFET